MLIISLVIIAIYLILVVRAKSTSQFISLLVGIFWALFFLIPYLFTRHFFPKNFHNYQDLGITFFTFLIFLSDYYFYKKSSNHENISIASNLIKKNRLIDHFLIPIVIIFIFLHYYLFGIPVLHLFDNKFNIAEARKLFGNLTGLTQIFFYVSNLLLNFIAPMILFYLFALKKYLKLTILGIFVFFYAFSSTAKLPVISLLIVTFVSFLLLKLSLKNIKRILTVFLICTSSFVVFGLQMTSTVESASSSTKSTPYVVFLDTPSDKLRDEGNFFTNSPNKFIKYMLYRSVYMPIEVSNRWYVYYQAENKPKRSIVKVISINENPKASNLVGIWAYYERFPEHYAPYINANASIDAEAFSFGNLWWLCIFPICYLILRLSIETVRNSQIHFFKFLGTLGIIHLGLTIYQSSLLAILIAQGFWIFPILAFSKYRLINRNLM